LRAEFENTSRPRTMLGSKTENWLRLCGATQLGGNERGIAALIGKADASRAAPFLMTQWSDAFAMVQAPEIGKPHWTSEYDAIRYRLAALAYSRDPASLPDTIRSYFDARWNNDSNH